MIKQQHNEKPKKSGYMKDRVCTDCGKEYEGTARSKTCMECRGTYKKVCKQCGVEFRTVNPKGQFHDLACAKTYHRIHGMGFYRLR